MGPPRDPNVQTRSVCYYLESAACKSMEMTVSGAASSTKGTLSGKLHQRQPQHLPQLGEKY